MLECRKYDSWKGGETMDWDFEFDVDLSEFDKELSELNEAAKNIAEYDKIFNEIMPN